MLSWVSSSSNRCIWLSQHFCLAVWIKVLQKHMDNASIPNILVVNPNKRCFYHQHRAFIHKVIASCSFPFLHLLRPLGEQLLLLGVTKLSWASMYLWCLCVFQFRVIHHDWIYYTIVCLFRCAMDDRIAEDSVPQKIEDISVYASDSPLLLSIFKLNNEWCAMPPQSVCLFCASEKKNADAHPRQCRATTTTKQREILWSWLWCLFLCCVYFFPFVSIFIINFGRK